MKMFSRHIGSFLFACASLSAVSHAEEGVKLPAPPASSATARNYANSLPFRSDGDQGLEDALSNQFPRSESDWQISEKTFYKKLLLRGKFDTLVVPFQVLGWSFDRSTRSLMTAALSLGFTRQGNGGAPDPYLVAKALGDGQRQFKQDEIFKLAEELGVKRIVWGYAGHDRQGKMRIKLLSRSKSQDSEGHQNWGDPAKESKFDEIAFTDEVPALEAYISLLPEMLKSLGIDSTDPLFKPVVSKLDLKELPDSPKDLASVSGNPARDAYTFLLYRALTPEMIERTKERFAEKAYLAQLHLSPASSEYKALRARTYMALGYRLAAIKAIGTPQTDEEREILATLNGDPDKLQVLVDLSVFQHGRKLWEQSAQQWCCQTAFRQPATTDYLELLQSIGHDNLIRKIRFQNEVQGRPESAIAIANSIESVYKGYPYYLLTRAGAEYSLAQQVGAMEQERLLKSAYLNASNTVYWEQGQSRVAESARRVAENTRRQDYGVYGNLYAADLPFRPYYWTWSDWGNMQIGTANHVAALNNATYEFDALVNLFSYYRQFFSKESKADDLLKSIDSRFLGSPARNRLLAEVAKRAGNSTLVETLYRDNLKLYPDIWKCYSDLGDLLLKKGDTSAAAKIYLTYPGFKRGADESHVGIANYAFDKGSMLYWSGYPELAKPLYTIAASQGTGAYSELTSAQRLKLMTGNIQGAMGDTLRVAQRYRDNYRYQDYIGMLHASGQSPDAWAGFSSLQEAGQGPYILESALVGHHITGTSEADVIAWVKQSGLKSGKRGYNAAAGYLLQFATTDRTPSVEAIAAIQEVDDARFQWIDKQGRKFKRFADQPPGPNERQIPSALALFAQGYRALKTQDFASAKSTFDEAANYDELAYTYADISYQFFLPYYAMAAAKTHNTEGMEKLLGSVAPEYRSFHYYLAQAVLEGAAGYGEKALQSLNAAKYFTPNLQSWPVLKSQTYGEIAEWVGEMSGSTKIKALTLDWAKKYQMMQPWLSWPYAMEAQLTQNPIDRKRALAMAHYLDPKSERLASFKQSEIDEAVKMFGKSNPFLKKQPRGASVGDV